MRVLHLSAGNLYGGIERLLVTLARERALCPGMTPEFGLCFDGRVADELRATGCAVHILGGPGGVRLRNPWTVWQARCRLHDLLGRERYGVDDAIVCHSAWPNAIFAAPARAASPSARLTFWLHDPPNGRPTFEERISNWTRPDLVVCNSRFTAARGSSLFPAAPRRVVYCPVSPPPDREASRSRRSDVRAAIGAPADAVVILQVGRWERHKGHLHHLAALAAMRDVAGWECWQVGAPQRPAEIEYAQEVKREAERLEIADRVRFLGWRDDLDDVMAAADIYCQPNVRAEPFGISFVEALHWGLPVVTTSLGAVAEIVDGSCGVVCEPGDVAALSGALRGMVQDSASRLAMAQAAPRRAVELCDPASRLAELHAFLGPTTRVMKAV